MATADPIAPTTTAPEEIDPFLAAVVHYLLNEPSLPEFTGPVAPETKPPANVMVSVPEDTAETLNARIDQAVSKNKGVCLLVIGGGGKNEDGDSPGPRCRIELELELYISPGGKRRDKAERPALALVVAIMRALHNRQIGEIRGCPWYENIRFESFTPIPDDDYIAYSLSFSRDMQF